MVVEQLEDFFINQEYQYMGTDIPQVSFYYKTDNAKITAVCLVNVLAADSLTEEQISLCREQAIAMFRSRGFIENHILTVLAAEDIEQAKRIAQGNYFCWIVDLSLGRLMIYENQIENFYGIRTKLERYLDAVATGNQALIRDQNRVKYIPWVTFSIMLINLIVFLACTFSGDLLYNEGAFSLAYLIYGNQYYRLITSMFLHANLMHLVSNMILLFVVGRMVERYCGSIPYLAIYFLSGIAGSGLSALGEMLTGSYAGSVGASGAVMGIIGALLAIVVYHKGKYKEITSRRILFMIAYVLYAGFTTTNVNNLAHVGGVIAGFILTLLYCLIRNAIAGRKGQQNEN